jgi:pimeloyl-ACP methyl ester carboxylesterase
MQTGQLEVEGASLFYKIEGCGPLLLLIQGGDGTAEGVAGIAADLAESYTVVSYDRRGLSRSTIEEGAPPVSLQVHSEDAFRLLPALTTEPALVFGASLGAVVGLDLISRHPEAVRALVAHEPPLPQLLPAEEAARFRQRLVDVEDAFARDGIGAAMTIFLAIAGMKLEEREPGVEFPAPAPDRQKNLTFMLANDAPAVRQNLADLPALKRSAHSITPAYGAASIGAWPNQSALALAAVLGRPAQEFPGAHSGFLTHPRAFADRLRSVFESVGA